MMRYAFSLTVEILISFKQHKQMSQSSAIIWLHLQYYVCSSKHFLNSATKLYLKVLNNKGNTIITGNFYDYCRYSTWFSGLKWSCTEKTLSEKLVVNRLLAHCSLEQTIVLLLMNSSQFPCFFQWYKYMVFFLSDIDISLATLCKF